jgi:exonuclease III
MKIVTWNCNGALRNKFESLDLFQADIYIVQECENPLLTLNLEYKKWAENHLWIGKNKNKGLGIFASKEIELKSLDWSNLYQNYEVNYFLPCSVNGKFNLLAVWNHKNNSPNFAYIGQFWKYLQINKTNFQDVIIAGDFNSNSKWDEWDRWWNHSDVVNELDKIGIESIYHKSTGEEHGKESIPTLYFRRKIDRPYHIDYIFGTKKLIEHHKKFEIGEAFKWLKLSDHMPILYESNLEFL